LLLEWWRKLPRQFKCIKYCPFLIKTAQISLQNPPPKITKIPPQPKKCVFDRGKTPFLTVWPLIVDTFVILERDFV
jgi:hypothetical protein